MRVRIKSEICDEKLLEMAKNGQKEALGMIYSRYFLLVFNKCQSFFHNTQDAADVTQDIMVKVFEHIGNFKGESKFSTWLYSVTFNHCTDQIRKRQKHQIESLKEGYEYEDWSGANHENEQPDVPPEHQVDELLSLLNPEEQQILVLKYQENKSIRDLQKKFDLSASAVKMRLMRARSKAVSVYSASTRSAA